MVRLLVLALILLVAGCNSQKSNEDVELNTAGVYTPVSITYNFEELKTAYDFGEYLIGSGPAVYKITIRNNSFFPITDLNLSLETFESFGFSFEKTEDGKVKYPGKTGTCGAILAPAHSCVISLQFETNISKLYEQPVTISYLNYIDAANKTINLSVLAGNPASLIFQDEITNYYFGELVGMAQIPVLEREIDQEYSQNLKIINAGDLKARNITNSNIILTQSCNSALTSDCPAGQNSAYRITHNCPLELKHGEFCNIVLYFRPLNGTAAPEMKKIRYDSTVKINYKTSSQGTDASLNAYATTNSVNIEAWFETSIESQVFENKIIVGNRDSRSFRVNNRGYRNGFMRKLVFKDLLGTHMASCVANPLTAPWLECYDQTVTLIKSLADFPFKIKDKDTCLASPFDEGKVILVDQGCQFDLQFQPSIAYQIAKVFNLEIFSEFDSLWKGNSTIAESQLHTLTAESQHAAKIIPVSITYNSATFPVVEDLISQVTYNAGRVGLMSQTNFRRKSLMITFKNVGGVAATAVVGKDGRANIIPQKELNPTGVTIGTYNPKYYINSLINTNNCTEIQPNQSCTMQMSFAPITLYSWNDNAENMFDVINLAAPLESYKQFIMTYQDGSSYLDANTYTPVIDSGANLAEARLQIDLVEKGQLDDYTSQNFNMGSQSQGVKYIREVRFSNIGTKDIPYIHYLGTKDLLSLTKSVTVIATNPASLDVDTLDCSTIFDFRYLPGDSLAVINARDNLWNPFPVNKDCLLTLSFFPQKRSFTSSDAVAGIALSKETARNTYVGTNATERGWEWSSGSYVDFDFILDSYDGDLTDPTATGPYAAQFGKYLQGKIAKPLGTYRQLAKIAPFSPRPMASSIIYRPGWNRPSVADELGVNFLIGSAIPDAWFFSDYTEQSPAFAGYDADFYKGILSKNFLPSGLALPTVTDYEFVYYLGRIPPGTPLNASLILANTGAVSASVRSVTINTIQRPNPLATTQNFTTSLTGLPFPYTMSVSTGATGSTVSAPLNTTYSFSGTDQGVYAAELLINYRDGGFDSVGPYTLPLVSPDPRVPREVQRKILIVGEVSSATPELKLDIQDYDIATDDLNPAVETLGTITPTPMSYFEGTTPILNFTSIKIPTPAKKDSYLKRRFIFYNTSGTTPIAEVKLFFRTSAASYTKDGLQSPSTYYVCLNGSQTNATLAPNNAGGVPQPMCTGTCGSTPFNLAPGGSCYIEIRYQPTGAAGSKSATLTALHKVGTDRYVHRNLDITFQPQNPASVNISNRTPQIIRTSLGTLNSYNLDFGSPIQTVNPMVFTYDAATTGGWNKRLALNNPSTTKASFLKTYQNYYKEFINPAITDTALRQVEPAYPADYTMNLGGVLYTLIYQKNYPSTLNPQVKVFANQACLVGDNTGNWFQKGFLGGVTCSMVPILYANINYINKTLSVNVAADMDPNYVRLQYYSANRASVAALTIHFTGSMKPNTAFVSAPTGINFYQEVKTSSVMSGQVKFKWAEMTVTTPALGPIDGYRVYYSPTASPLNIVFPAATTPFVDTPLSGTGLYELTHNSLGTNKFMYYRIFPIRLNAAYNVNPNPFGLPGGRYLSDPNVPILPVVIPNALYMYEHAGRYLIEKGVYNQNLLTHAQAKTQCSGRPRLSITEGPSFRQFNYAMINTPVWNIIKNRPTESNYNLTDYPLWLDSSVVNIHTTLLPHPQYNPASDLAYLDIPMLFYIKKTGCGTNCSGNTAVANAFGQPNYTSYVESTVNFAGARCYILLP